MTPGKTNSQQKGGKLCGDWLFLLICLIVLMAIRLSQNLNSIEYARINSGLFAFLLAFVVLLWIRGKGILESLWGLARIVRSRAYFVEYFKSGELFFVILLGLSLYVALFLLDLSMWKTYAVKLIVLSMIIVVRLIYNAFRRCSG